VVHRYAYFKKLDYFSTECIYSPDAYRGHARAFLKDLESARPSAIIDIIHSGEAFAVNEEVKATQKAQRELLSRSDSFHELMGNNIETCKRCGYMSSNELCKACSLLEGLERGIAAAGIVSVLNLLPGIRAERIYLQTDRARKKMDAEGPAPEGLRTIPYFQMPTGPGPSTTIQIDTS